MVLAVEGDQGAVAHDLLEGGDPPAGIKIRMVRDFPDERRVARHEGAAGEDEVEPEGEAVALAGVVEDGVGVFEPAHPRPGINARATRKKPGKPDSLSPLQGALLTSPGIDARAGAVTRDRL